MTDRPGAPAPPGAPPLAEIGACVFDAYGTLFDVHAPLRRLADTLGERAPALSETWRVRQLQYTWLRSLMGRYADFWQVTGDALDHAMAAHGIADLGVRARLMEMYLRLDAYPDAPACLAAVRARRVKTAILSNGAPTMLAAAVDHAGLRGSLDQVLSVDPLQVYKPDPRTYRLACDRLGLPAARIAFVSANGWDIAGAASFGLKAVWLNRTGTAPETLPGRPVAEIGGLDRLAALVAPASPRSGGPVGTPSRDSFAP